MKINIDKIENAYLLNVPAFDDKGEVIEYEYKDYAFYTLEEVLAKVQEVYGS